MKILLDTHIFIWWLEADKKLSKKAKSLILEAETVCVSSVSIWEAIIKIRLGKLQMNLDDLTTSIEKEGFEALSFSVQHAQQVALLPNYHRDPFDRALVAQAISEPAHFVTGDAVLCNYSPLVIQV